jgi:hypothetical protein
MSNKYRFSALGDVNGDGYEDFLVSDMYYNKGKGVVYVIHGRSLYFHP